MKNNWVTGYAIRVAVFYFSFTGVCQSLQAQQEIPLRLVRDRVIIVSITAHGQTNEQGRFDFVLDTGTNTTIVDPLVARTLSLPTLDHIRVTTLAASGSLPRSSVPVLALGPVQVQNVEVLIRSLAEVRNELDPRIEGIVGQNFLSHLNYLLDYQRRSLRVEIGNEIEEAISGERVPIEVQDNNMLVDSEARSPGVVRLRLQLDSGTNSVLLVGKAYPSLDLAAKHSSLEVTSNGKVGLVTGRIQTLTVGSLQLRHVLVALASEAPDALERIGDGLLSTALFRSLYINNREDFVVFNPRAKRK